tara:strand:- start:160 stop:465 length:306 start_codon:yes stop_codon:yes gene_type:complete
MFNFITTPSHGYLMVPEVNYRASGYKASRSSYRADGYVYLEEDCDAPGFMKAAGVTSDQFRDTYVERDITENLTPMSGAGFISPFAGNEWADNLESGIVNR